MNYLQPIYRNNIGTSYMLKSYEDCDAPFNKIQLQIGEIAVLLSKKELKHLLNVIHSAKKGCHCTFCGDKTALKAIKCDTMFATLHFKTTPKNVETLEELIQGTLFELEMEEILSFNDIY